MKIIEIMPIFAACGVTRFVVDLSNALCEAHRVTIIVFYDHGTKYRDELHHNIRVISLSKKPGADIGLFLRLTRLLAREKADIVHLHTASSLHYAIAACWSIRSSRFVYTYHSVSSFETPQRPLRFLQKWLLFRSGRCSAIANSRCVADSLHHRAELISLGRSLHTAMLTDPTAQREIAQLRQRHGGTILLSVANVAPVKNQLMLCRCAERLLSEGYNLELVLIGRKAEDNYSRELMRHIGGRIHFLGERDLSLAYMKEADFLCISSTTESGPLTLIEAFFAGLIPISTPCGDVPHKISNGINGFCSIDSSDESYCESLRCALRLSPDQRQAMQARVRASYPRYSIENCARRYTAHFNLLHHP